MSRAAAWTGLGAATGVVAVLSWLWLTSDAPSEPAGRGSQPLSGSAPRTSSAAAGVDREHTAQPFVASPQGQRESSGASAQQTNADGKAATQPRKPALAPASAVHVAGVARDELGFELADHVVEVSSEESGLEGSDVTDAEGRYRVELPAPGLKELRLLGPGTGDVWRRDRITPTAPIDDTIRLTVEEQRLTVAVPASGSDDIVLRSRGHREIQVTGRLVDDAFQPVAFCDFLLAREAEPVAHVASNAKGEISGLVTVREDASFEFTFERSAWREVQSSLPPMDPPAPMPARRYMPINVQLWTTPRQQDLGTLVMPRMAGLELTLVDAADGHALSAASVHWRCTGGGLPPTEEQGESGVVGLYVLWSGRTAGEYELDVSAPGYKPAHRVGVLMAGDGPVPLELILERNR